MTETTSTGPAKGEEGRALPQRARRSREGASMREEILNAAREEFAGGGYDRTSVRAIARAAGVDPALVHHYFGSKEKLFATAVALPAVPSELIEALLAGDREHIAERWLRTLFTMWENEDANNRMAALVRSMTSGEPRSAMLRDFLTRHVLARIAAALGVERPELRAAMAGSQVIGLFIARSVVGVEPLAKTDAEYLIACYAPIVQRCLTGPLPDPVG
ncbi:TetR/AcrR family transcriptional regulator [Wenjunlia tyrosinilytica]|uniref:TetR/AcrR family transcriptional regulator n=1 Tax=Wenjunlia tyrosinilytica TaxID=1544741 RepID=UPI0016631EEA|nr:TetR family transcriptional regulator [Wenjunlia tyrosinilytica]